MLTFCGKQGRMRYWNRVGPNPIIGILTRRKFGRRYRNENSIGRKQWLEAEMLSQARG